MITNNVDGEGGGDRESNSIVGIRKLVLNESGRVNMWFVCPAWRF